MINQKIDGRIRLNVPFAERTAAKKAGATWYKEDRGWYINSGRPREKFVRWLPRMFKPDAEPPHIIAEMVPSPSWYINLRLLLPKSEWDRLRKDCYQKAGYCCQVCGGRGSEWPVECNEQWQYLDQEDAEGFCTQRLLRLVALCPACHWIKHLGKAIIEDRHQEALEQLSYVNGWTEEQCAAHSNEAFDIWDARSDKKWKFDLSFLSTYGIEKIGLKVEPLLDAPKIQGVDVSICLNCTRAFNTVSIIEAGDG